MFYSFSLVFDFFINLFSKCDEFCLRPGIQGSSVKINILKKKNKNCVK